MLEADAEGVAGAEGYSLLEARGLDVTVPATVRVLLCGCEAVTAETLAEPVGLGLSVGLLIAVALRGPLDVPEALLLNLPEADAVSEVLALPESVGLGGTYAVTEAQRDSVTVTLTEVLRDAVGHMDSVLQAVGLWRGLPLTTALSEALTLLLWLAVKQGEAEALPEGHTEAVKLKLPPGGCVLLPLPLGEALMEALPLPHAVREPVGLGEGLPLVRALTEGL